MSDSLGLNGLSDHNYGKTTADKLRAKRFNLMKEKELAFEESKKPTRRDYALEKEMVRERMALKKKFAEEQVQLEADLAAEREARDAATAAAVAGVATGILGGILALFLGATEGAVKAADKGFDKMVKAQDTKYYGRGGWRRYYGKPRRSRKNRWF